MALTKISRGLLGTGVVNNTDGGIIISTDGYGRALLLPADENGTAENNLHYIGSSSYRWRDIYLSGSIDFNSDAVFKANGSERMRIDSSGNLFLGTTSGTGKFNMDFSSIFGQVFKYTGSSNPFAVVFDYGSSTVGSITLTSSATSFNTSSDYRLKENINYEFDALDRVKQLKPARFNFIADADTTVDGFIAHEVSDIVPEAITGEKDGEQMQGIDQSKLVPLLTKAIQELSAKVEELESKINE